MAVDVRLHPFTARVVLLALLTACTTSCIHEPDSHSASWPELEGYWEGEFMPGNDLTLVLDFSRDTSGRQHARVLLFEGVRQIQDDPLTRVELDESALTFLIAAKETPFDGVVVGDSAVIRGNFRFPDGSIHPVLVHRVDRPSLGQFPAATQRTSAAAPLISSTYEPELLREDVEFLRDQLEAHHPQLYSFVSREDFGREQAERSQHIDDAMTSVEFARVLAPWLATIGCAHTGVRIPQDVATELEEQPVFLPLDVRILNDSLFVLADYSGNGRIRPGTGIDTINGTSSESVITAMRAQLASDGRRASYQTFQLNADFSRSYVHLVEAPEYYDLVLKTPLGQSRRVRLDATTFVSLEKLRTGKYASADPTMVPPFKLEMLPDHDAALLRIPAFLAPSEEVFEEFLRETFARLSSENTQNLILDVRGNQGGPPVFAARLLSYLTPTPLTYFAKTDGPAAPAWLYEPIIPRPDRFSGDLFVLVDGGSISTTGHLLAVIHRHRLGVLVGEEPGGSFECNDNSLALQLPNSALDVRIPRTRFVADVSGFESGDPVPVDHAVRADLNDLINGIDRPLEFALELIGRQRTASTPDL